MFVGSEDLNQTKCSMLRCFFQKKRAQFLKMTGPNLHQLSIFGPNLHQLSIFGPNLHQLSIFGPNLHQPSILQTHHGLHFEPIHL